MTYSLRSQGQAFSLKAMAKTFVRCPRGSSRPRPGLEDNKTAQKSRWDRARSRSLLHMRDFDSDSTPLII